MLSYKEYVNMILYEGILKVDKELLSFMKSALIINLANKILPQLKTSETKQQLKNLTHSYMKSHDEYILENKIKTTDNVYFGLTYNNNGLTGKFNYHLGVKSLNESNGASFHRGDVKSLPSIKVVYDKKLVMNINDWIKTPTTEKLEIVFNSKMSQVEHELAHFVEWMITTKTGNYKKIKSGYDDNEADYFTSDIEFEPMIISIIRNFEYMIKYFKIKNKEPMSVSLYKELIKDILSDKEYEELDSTFLLYSKKLTPQKYKIIARKVYIELMNNIEELITQGYLQK